VDNFLGVGGESGMPYSGPGCSPGAEPVGFAAAANGFGGAFIGEIQVWISDLPFFSHLIAAASLTLLGQQLVSNLRHNV